VSLRKTTLLVRLFLPYPLYPVPQPYPLVGSIMRIDKLPFTHDYFWSYRPDADLPIYPFPHMYLK
jgi:hypothetical protein